MKRKQPKPGTTKKWTTSTLNVLKMVSEKVQMNWNENEPSLFSTTSTRAATHNIPSIHFNFQSDAHELFRPHTLSIAARTFYADTFAFVRQKLFFFIQNKIATWITRTHTHTNTRESYQKSMINSLDWYDEHFINALAQIQQLNNFNRCISDAIHVHSVLLHIL